MDAADYSSSPAIPAPSSIASPWQSSFHATVPFPLHRVWEITGDFIGVHKWAPSVVSRCTLLEGAANTVGCLRRCDGADGHFLGKEVLLEISQENHLHKYRVEDSIIPGLTGYVSTFQVSDAGNSVTSVAWSYEVPPIASSSPADFRDMIFGYYQRCIEDLEKCLSAEC